MGGARSYAIISSMITGSKKVFAKDYTLIQRRIG